MDIVLFVFVPFMFFVAWLLMRRRKACPECGETLPIFQFPLTKTRRQWLAGGYACQRCGCETDLTGQKVTAESPPARFPLATVSVLLAAVLGGAGLVGILLGKPVPKQVAAETPLVGPALAPGARGITAKDEVESKSYPVLSGVGLALHAKDGHIDVSKVLPNSPADKSGMVREGARLVSVEVNGMETPLVGTTYSEAADLIRGPVGTELVLTVVPSKDDAVIKVRLVRAPLEVAGTEILSVPSSFQPSASRLHVVDCCR